MTMNIPMMWPRRIAAGQVPSVEVKFVHCKVLWLKHLDWPPKGDPGTDHGVPVAEWLNADEGMGDFPGKYKEGNQSASMRNGRTAIGFGGAGGVRHHAGATAANR